MTQLSVRVSHPTVASFVVQGTLNQIKDYFSKELEMNMDHIDNKSQLYSFLESNIHRMFCIRHSSIFNFDVKDAKRITKKNLIQL